MPALLPKRRSRWRGEQVRRVRSEEKGKWACMLTRPDDYERRPSHLRIGYDDADPVHEEIAAKPYRRSSVRCEEGSC